MSWRIRRRFLYASVTTLLLVVAIGVPLFILYHEAPSCYDSTQNGLERGVDCGGECSRMCSADVAPPVVKWSRALPVTENNYSAVAYIENPNRDAGIKSISYKFSLFNNSNILITEREGVTYIAPGSISPVFESSINTKGDVPARTFFEFTEEPIWYKAVDIRDRLSVKNKFLSRVDSRPRLDATIINSSAVDEFIDVDVVAVIFGTDGNAIAASKTVIPILSIRGSHDIVYTWPKSFGKRIEQCTSPADIMLLIDTSGSMNDDGGDPPQPISDAKLAATAFVGRLSSNDRVGIVSFATNATVKHILSIQHFSAGESITDLYILKTEERGSTNVGEAIEMALKEFNAAPDIYDDNIKIRKVAVLLTDGKANAPIKPGGEEYAHEKAVEAKEEDVVFYTIGLGDKVNKKFLSSLASSPDKYYQAIGSGDLDGIYRSISESICERGPAVIDILPRTQDVFRLAQ